eukprot:EG_transcript_46299
MAQKVSLVFCMNPTIPMSLVEDPFFQQAFGHPFGRNGIAEEIYLLVEGIRSKIGTAIAGSSVALALDGATKWSHEKVINFVILWKGKAIFWNTLPSKYGKSATTLFSLVQMAVGNIEARFKVTVDSLIA